MRSHARGVAVACGARSRVLRRALRGALIGLLGAASVDALAVPTCSVASGATLSFGTVVALASTGDVSANSGSTFWVNCTADVGAAPLLYSASTRTLVSGPNTLPFGLSATVSGGVELPASSPGTMLGIARNGTNQTVVLYGRIAASNFKGLPSGMYSTSLSLTLEY